jgi:Domain of unknown function (DUF4374)
MNLNSIIKLFFSVIFAFCLLSCRQGNSVNEKDAKYSLYILTKDGREYMLISNTLDSGMLKPETDGAYLDPKDMDRDVFVKNGFFYHLNRKTNRFSKFKLEDGKLVTTGFLDIKDFSIENFNWIGKDSLILTGLNLSGYNHSKYIFINTVKMEAIAQGDMEIPAPSGHYTTLSIGFVEKKGNALLVGYTYHKAQGVSSYLTSDTLYVSELSYPQMKLLSTQKDIRSTYPGGINTIQSYNFKDDRGDYYFQSCPGIALGNHPDLPTGIFKIKANEKKIDQGYFFNISSSKIQNHAYGMWYLGGNKAIIRSERKDLFKGLGDHYSTAHFEFYILDLLTQSVTRLNLPLDKGTRRECVIVEGDTAYISVNSTKSGNYIWLYNIKTGELKKGMQLGGDTDFIMRIDRLKD